MDHGGQFEREGRVMSQLEGGGVDLCDNLPNPETLAALNQNLNVANVLTKTESLLPSQNEDTEGCRLIQDASLCNVGLERCTGTSNREDDEEDIDEMMKEDEEEEEESEGSSCPIRCQSPDTPMTDSSYSETGSLLETPCPFSPGTSPEPTSPVIPVVSPEIEYHFSHGELSQKDIKVDSQNSNPESFVSNMGPSSHTPNFTAGPADSSSRTLTSDPSPSSPPGPTEVADRKANCTSECTSSNDTISSQELTFTSSPETFTETIYATKLNTSIPSPSLSTTAGPSLSFTGSISTSTTGPITSNLEHITSTPVPTCFSVSTCATGPIPSPALLESLEQLAQRGDNIHLPQYLHQIAEAFVLHEDYQRALCCIQLERLYHQRVLDNLNALQEQWESRCKRTSSDLATQHLDKLIHICKTHSRPTAGDAECTPEDSVRPTFEEAGALAPCTTVHQLDKGTEQRLEDSSHQRSSPVEPSINLGDGSKSPEISAKDKEDPDRELRAGAFPASQLNDKQSSNREGVEEGGGGGYTISTSDNKLHPPTAGEMEQSKPAEQQGGGLGLAQEKEAKREEEESNVEGETEVLKMEDDGEEEEGEEKQKEGDSPLCQKALLVETLASGEEVEVQQLHQEDSAEEKLHEDTQESSITSLHSETKLPQEAHLKQQEQVKEEEQEEEWEEYELEQVDIIREAATLDDMAKLITVEEISPASGLVSILKRRNVCLDNVSVSATSRSEKSPAKRRVHFKVPEDGYEQEVGGGDSCLLLFLLCLVTVVISVGGTALYCALGDAHSSVCQDFSRNADFYTGQIQRGLAHIQHWFTPGS